MHAIVAEKNVEERTRHVLSEIFADCSLDKVGVQLWDGTAWPDQRPRSAMLALKHSGALGRMFLPGTEVGLAEAYLRDDFDIEGDIAVAFEIGDFLLARLGDWRNNLKLAGLLVALPERDGRSTMRRAASQLLPRIRGKRHSLERDRRAVTLHYDVSNDFYRLWLDRQMVYSCAYLTSQAEELDVAQECKLDYLCRKLRLRPGERLLDIGCGWGALVIHAAKHFGVRAKGLTLSEPQAEWARARIAEAGLTNEATIDLRDYREIASDGSQLYDAIVSVGMAEHVGREKLPDYFSVAHHALKPGGVFLNQAIGEGVVGRPDNRNGSFIEQYVFPDSDIPPLPVVLRAAESAGFEIRDVENLREHYALTLRHWLRRLETHYAEALSFVDEATYRVWRLYLAGSAHGFRRAHIAVYQTLLAKLDSSGQTKLPLTRDDWYTQSRALRSST
ncbi:MAG TPA: cyclopropane-fatty-acyl-phospholipid synthase family protein [Chthoniobacterales bacterium]|jgi:cyclopropane-fatty-acyl-phospholipid synthase|nr:cyclopropane-fatty-acyl-phospholipid synthase family protein [Chthoniobacterales bacterium]